MKYPERIRKVHPSYGVCLKTVNVKYMLKLMIDGISATEFWAPKSESMRPRGTLFAKELALLFVGHWGIHLGGARMRWWSECLTMFDQNLRIDLQKYLVKRCERKSVVAIKKFINPVVWIVSLSIGQARGCSAARFSSTSDHVRDAHPLMIVGTYRNKRRMISLVICCGPGCNML